MPSIIYLPIWKTEPLPNTADRLDQLYEEQGVHGEYKNKPEYNRSELITMEETDELYGWYFVAMDNLLGKRSILTLILIGTELLTRMLLMARYEKKMLSGLKLY